MRRSSITRIVVALAMVLANCLGAVAQDRARSSSAPATGDHLMALRLATSVQVVGPRLKAGHERVLVGSSPCDRSPAALAPTRTPAATLHVTARLSGGLQREAPSACRPPPQI